MAPKVEKVQYFGRNSVVLSNGKVRTVVEDIGGMTPEFSLIRGKAGINAHWVPDFRSNSGQPWNAALHAPFWKGQILYTLAGEFPCSPNFGPDCTVNGTLLPPHGWTANNRWSIVSTGIFENENVAYAELAMQSPDAGMPLSYENRYVLQQDQAAYYSVLSIKNRGASPIAINVAHHNTVGSSFLQAGCRVYASARGFMAAPAGTEFDNTARLAQGAQFENLSRAPCRDGTEADLTLVPGMTGFTDFVTGAVPTDARLGWSGLVHPVLKLAYLTFFPGAQALPAGEITLGFNDLWMQYGGRNFTPWAFNEGGTDRTFCLGTENAVGAFANGLEYSRAHPILLDTPTTITIPANGERHLLYGTALVELADALTADPITDIEADEGAIIIKTMKAYQRVKLDGSFASLRAVAHSLDKK